MGNIIASPIFATLKNSAIVKFARQEHDFHWILCLVKIMHISQNMDQALELCAMSTLHTNL